MRGDIAFRVDDQGVLASSASDTLLTADEPDTANAAWSDLIDRGDLEWVVRHAMYSLLIDHLVAEHHAIDQLGMEIRQGEAVLAIVLAEGNFASRHDLAGG